jgi:hypothetical protein
MMTVREITQLLVNVGQITNYLKSLNINKDAIATHALTLKAARIKMDKWQEQYQSEETRKSMSPPEQQNLMKNMQNLYGVYQELQKELDFLDMSKQTEYVVNAVKELEHAFLLIEWLQDSIGKNGEIILPHLTCIREKTWEGGKYKNKVDSLFSEVEAIAYDFYQDQVVSTREVGEEFPILIPIAEHLIVAGCWLNKEKQRLVTEALPEIKKIELPEEVKLEVPAGPEELKN